MGRDYSAPFPDAPRSQGPRKLEHWGWTPFFAQQIDADTMAATPPVRVTAVHRSGLNAAGDGIEVVIPPGPAATVGDWLLWDADQPRTSRVLERKSLIKRRAAGIEERVQLIAANIDTVFIVTSCNEDFNVARLERYLALAFDAGVDPVILLTKADLAGDVAAYVTQAEALSDRAPVIALDARGDAPAQALAPWCKPGLTVAFLGSSGVGKSTLTNALLGSDLVATQAVRADDAKGRHTTTHRALHVVPGGCLVLDTPGMREVQLLDASTGIAEVFDDIDTLAQSCRFSDCAHEVEPGCAITAALAAGTLDEARLERWRKLQAEDAMQGLSRAEKRKQSRALSKRVRSAVTPKPGK